MIDILLVLVACKIFLTRFDAQKVLKSCEYNTVTFYTLEDRLVKFLFYVDVPYPIQSGHISTDVAR